MVEVVKMAQVCWVDQCSWVCSGGVCVQLCSRVLTLSPAVVCGLQAHHWACLDRWDRPLLAHGEHAGRLWIIRVQLVA